MNVYDNTKNQMKTYNNTKICYQRADEWWMYVTIHKRPNEEIQQHKNMLLMDRWIINVCDDTQKTKRRNTTTQKYVINGQMNNKCMWRYIKNQTNTSNKPKIYH